MVGPDGALPLPWLDGWLAQALRSQRSHALLIHGPAGIGQWQLSLTLAQAWLCDSPADAGRPCGHCASCRLVQARSHPDLLVLLPEALQAPLGWTTADADAEPAESGSKSKQPSKEIKVEAVRGAVAFAQTTPARHAGKVVVLHPAERMNAIAANALLKTLEEPAGSARFILSCAEPEALLPTIRSRCQAIGLKLPDTGRAAAWLGGQGVAAAELVLAGAGGQPLDALERVRDGIDARTWAQLPQLAKRGDGAALTGWSVIRVVDALQKLCHDALCVAVGASPRYFPADALGARGDVGALLAWSRDLQRMARQAEHPLNAGLAIEALFSRARLAFVIEQGDRAARRGISVHSKT